jgi:hypothetical protein
VHQRHLRQRRRPAPERYADEQVFRFNERKTTDAGRFALATPGVVGKRLQYKELIEELPAGEA